MPGTSVVWRSDDRWEAEGGNWEGYGRQCEAAPDSRVWLLEQARKAANVEGSSAPSRTDRGMPTSIYIAIERVSLERSSRWLRER